MLGNNLKSDKLFWVDDPDPYSPPKTTKWNVATRFSTVLSNITYVARFFVLLVFVWLALKFPFAWLFVLLEGGMLIARLYYPRHRAALATQATQIQQLAKQKTGAAYIGSALHTAGHPLLQVNQPVVLALKDAELSIYSYTSSNPLDTVRVKDLLSVDTVVYDDDRVPHFGVIDNTAQALQLSFPWHGNTCTCLFRRMYKVRPIEWYQAIQTARLLPAG